VHLFFAAMAANEFSQGSGSACPCHGAKEKANQGPFFRVFWQGAMLATETLQESEPFSPLALGSQLLLGSKKDACMLAVAFGLVIDR
jgi:hypothetical protein